MLDRGREAEGGLGVGLGWEWDWGGGGGNLSLLQSESPGSTANDQSTASHCSVEGTGHSGSGPGCQ